ncbi:hypothetical protein RLOC_00014979 [Lonchura striata]|uniref:Uncharacterized protein n=1 Tax=Lonchura striata TaxID=40157 RepID=A0A218V4F8_9PASE|nr:hypothetical protein RLOC_00014979 [Lonchura striata domestica]
MTFVLKIISYTRGGIVTIKLMVMLVIFSLNNEEPWQLFSGRIGCVFLFTDCKPSGTKHQLKKKS